MIALLDPEYAAISSRTAKFFPIKLSLKRRSSGGYPVIESSGKITTSDCIFSASSNVSRILDLFSCIAPTENESCAPVSLIFFVFTIQ